MPTTARIENGHLIVEGSPLGLSFAQISERQEKNLFRIDCVYVYKFSLSKYRSSLPKYLKGREEEIIRGVINLLRKTYEEKERLILAGEVGKYFLSVEDNNLTAVFYIENSVYNIRTAREFRALIGIAMARIKRPFYIEWKATRQSAKSASYVKPSQSLDN